MKNETDTETEKPIYYISRGFVILVNIYKGCYRSHDLLSFEVAKYQVLGALFCLFLCFRSYPEKLKVYTPTFYRIRFILEELYVAVIWITRNSASRASERVRLVAFNYTPAYVRYTAERGIYVCTYVHAQCAASLFAQYYNHWSSNLNKGDVW